MGAVAAWTWYPIVNARHMKANPQLASWTWTTAQGLTTLPLAVLGFIGYGVYASVSGINYAFPFGPQPLLFTGLMLALGLCASWLGTLLWNGASQRLPTSLAGQLIVFETLAALSYAFLWRGTIPAIQVLVGIVMLCAGVLLGMRAFRTPSMA